MAAILLTSSTQVQPGSSTDGSSTVRGPSKVFKLLTNKSEEKIKNNLLSCHFKNRITRSVTSQKLRFLENQKYSQPVGNSLIDMDLLSNLIETATICKICKDPNSKLTLLEVPNKRSGLAQHFILKCNICSNETEFCTSKHASCQNGLGLAGLQKLTATLDLPRPINPTPYNKDLKSLTEKAEEQSEIAMKAAADRLITFTKTMSPENVMIVNDSEVCKVAVSVDGTWQKRGYSSKIGVVFIISVDSGEILDAIVKSLTCVSCTKHDQSSPDFEKWYTSHKDSCDINHSGSSSSMETNGAIEMFQRSIDKYGLMYSTFVGDGDSDCFGSVKEACASLEMGYDIEKEECIGHIQKRLGSALREYKRQMRGKKLSDGKTVGGRKRLTDLQIDRMQNHFGEAIRNNVGDLEQMKTGIAAILSHMVSQSELPLKKQHDSCPRNDWCKFWSNPGDYNESKRLPDVFYPELKPIFNRLSKDNLLKRCLKGLTQNQNEAANGVLWSKCSKRKFCGLTKVKLAVAQTTCEFNTGNCSTASLQMDLNLPVSRNTVVALKQMDDTRIKHAAQKISIKARLTRRKARAKKHAKKSDKKGLTYIPGGFGVEKTPDLEFIVSGKKSKPNNVELRFISDETVKMIVSYTRRS